MRNLLRVIVILLLAGFGFIVWLVVRQGRPRTDLLASEVSADSIEVYRLRADSLAAVADRLAADYERAGALGRPGMQRRLTALNGEIEALRVAIDKWRSARNKYGQGQAYRECILLYGRASGVCDNLSEESGAEPDSQ